jgi:hypothetical protein
MKNVQNVLTKRSELDQSLQFTNIATFNTLLFKSFENVAQPLQFCDGAPPAGCVQEAAQRVKQSPV